MSRVIVALDVSSSRAAMELVDRLGPAADFYKVGQELFLQEGPAVVESLRAQGKEVFLDLKLLDVPGTVAGAVRAAVASGAALFSVHTLGGQRMLQLAAEAAGDCLGLVGVTVLTSWQVPELEEVLGRELTSVRDEVLRLAGLAKEAGLAGVMTSVEDAEALKRRYGSDFLVVTPGIRLPGESAGDVIRASAPGAAVKAGVDFLVVGRVVSGAPDPLKALNAILDDLEAQGGLR